MPSPLLRNLVKGIVWGLFAIESKSPTTFIVTTEGAFSDADGAVVRIPEGSSISIVHPLDMGAECLAGWQRLFVKNKQLQPFAPRVRKVYRAEGDLGEDRFGLDGAIVASMSLKGLLATGWENQIEFGDAIFSINRKFESGIASLFAEPGVHITNYEMQAKEQKLSVDIPDTLSPVEFSEVIRDLLALKK